MKYTSIIMRQLNALRRRDYRCGGQAVHCPLVVRGRRLTIFLVAPIVDARGRWWYGYTSPGCGVNGGCASWVAVQRQSYFQTFAEEPRKR